MEHKDRIVQAAAKRLEDADLPVPDSSDVGCEAVKLVLLKGREACSLFVGFLLLTESSK